MGAQLCTAFLGSASSGYSSPCLRRSSIEMVEMDEIIVAPDEMLRDYENINVAGEYKRSAFFVDFLRFYFGV